MSAASPQSYTWNINDDAMIKQIKHAEVTDEFQSDIFEMHGLKWTLIIYPSGYKDKHKGYIGFHLELQHLPSQTNKIEVKYKLIINELNTEYES
eukprot:239404_1